MSSLRRALAVLGVLLLVGGGVVWWRARPRPGAGAPASPTAASSRPTPGAGRAATGDDGEPPDTAGTFRLEGQVIDAEEHPIGGAVVAVSSTPRRTVTTEADGSFVFDRLLPRGYSVVAVKGDGIAGPQPVRLSSHTEPVILRLARAGGVEVTVVGAGTRHPVAGASVTLGDIAEATADAEGKATLRPIAKGRHVVRAQAPGFAAALALVATGGKPNEMQHVTVELARGAAVAGRVVDDAGQAVAGALVRAQAANAGPFAGRANDPVKTDDAGRFAFVALPAGRFRFTATHDEHGPGESEAVALDGASAKEGVVVTLEAGAHIAGRVTKTDGTPVAAALVRVTENGGGGRGRRRGGGTGGGGPGGPPQPPRQTYTDAQGAFELRGIARRPSDVVAVGETSSSKALTLDLATKPEQTDLSVVLDVDGQIAGIVLDSKGEPVEGAQVTAGPAGAGPGAGHGGGPGVRREGFAALRARGPVQETTDAGGRFVLAGLADGTYRVSATRNAGAGGGGDFRPGPGPRGGGNGAVASVGDKNVRVTLDEDGHVKGKVLYADGSAPDSFQISTGGPGPGLAFGSGDGSFEVDAPTGPATLTVSGPQFQPVTVPNLHVDANADTDVGTVTVTKGRSISGTVYGSDGQPVAGARVLAGSTILGGGADLSLGGGAGAFTAGSGTQTTTSGDDGGYVVSGVTGGNVLIAADHETAGRTSIQRVPTGDGNVNLDLRLQAPGALSGRVTSAGEPLAGTPVTVTPQTSGLSVFAVRSDDTGAFRFDKLAPDTYTVSGRTGNPGRGSSQSKTVVVVAGQEAHVDLEITQGSVTVNASVTPPGGVTLGGAQVVLASGSLTATTAAQLADATSARGEGQSVTGFGFAGMPAVLPNVAPGAYTACAVPLPANVTGMGGIGAMAGKLDKLVCACAPVTIAATPDTQSINIPVPAPAPLRP